MKTLPLVLASLFYSSIACAQSSEDWDGGYGTRAKRRGGFALEVDWGLGLGNTNGYPKDAVKLNDPRYEADSELAVGELGRVVLGGAIRDWFSFGLGIEMLRMRGNSYTTTGGAFILRPVLFPLWTLGGAYRDFGVFSDFGIGWMDMEKGALTAAEGGSLAKVGVGCFDELVRWKNLGIGPSVGVTHYFSQTMKATVVEIGARLAFTTSP